MAAISQVNIHECSTTEWPNICWTGSCKKSFQRPEPLILQREQVSAGGHVDTIPTVVLTPDSPPQHSPTGKYVAVVAKGKVQKNLKKK